jgi:hypothetical protein
MRRAGAKITRDLIREVHALFPQAELRILMQHWA